MASNNQTFILASRSPRRIQFLKELGVKFQSEPSPVEEVIQPDKTPEENALQVARDKALWAAEQHKGAFVLGADTLVSLNGDIIGKPVDHEDARRILKKLSGREHQVITGVAIINPNNELFEQAVTSKVKIKPLTDEEISRYIRSGEPMDKAGAYAIQGKGSSLVASYQGSYSNIVGLPIETVEDLLKQAGYVRI
ncbi:MAG: Maf family protein [Nitrospinales bacterium]